LHFLGDWITAAANEPNHSVHGYIFEHPLIEGLAVRAEIEDLLWLHPDDMNQRNDLAPLLTERVLPALQS
jgi:8-oxo-dGTP diphosphatase